MGYTINQFNKEAISCEQIKVSCKSCSKEWTYGEYSPWEGDFHDNENFAKSQILKESQSTEAIIHLCSCGSVLRVFVSDTKKDNLVEFIGTFRTDEKLK